jgi:hypothetical protein
MTRFSIRTSGSRFDLKGWKGTLSMHRPARYRRQDLVDFDWVWRRDPPPPAGSILRRMRTMPRAPVVTIAPERDLEPSQAGPSSSTPSFEPPAMNRPELATPASPANIPLRTIADDERSIPKDGSPWAAESFADRLRDRIRRLAHGARVLEWADGWPLGETLWGERPDLDVLLATDRREVAAWFAARHPHWRVVSHLSSASVRARGLRLLVVGLERLGTLGPAWLGEFAHSGRDPVIAIPPNPIRITPGSEPARWNRAGWRAESLGFDSGLLLQPTSARRAPTRRPTRIRSASPVARRRSA